MFATGARLRDKKGGEKYLRPPLVTTARATKKKEVVSEGSHDGLPLM
jgi:hypothetical protein